jgi:two-component system, NarL family, nitrate/nitrite response regulator NarL
MINENEIKLLVVDDHPMVLEGMRVMLQQISFANLTATAYNAFEAIEALRQWPEIEVAIVDINLPDISGIDLTEKIRREFPKVKVLAMSTFNERSYISQMIQNGASGYLVKSASKEEIEEAILCAHEGKMYLSAELQTSGNLGYNVSEKLPLLTTREKEVLQLIAEGMTNPQIAQQLFISLHTVDSHRKNLLTKFEVNNTAGLIKLAAKYNMI